MLEYVHDIGHEDLLSFEVEVDDGGIFVPQIFIQTLVENVVVGLSNVLEAETLSALDDFLKE